MQQKYRDQVQFVLVYLREAHPKGGWEIGDWSVLADPKTFDARRDVAAQCCEDLKFDFPAVADTMDDRTAIEWSGWPERLFVISKEGRIVYTGDMGPFGFNPSIAYTGYNNRKSGCVSLERFLSAYLGDATGKTDR